MSTLGAVAGLVLGSFADEVMHLISRRTCNTRGIAIAGVRSQGDTKMRWVFYRGVFGCWGWEKLGDGGEFVSESRDCFESRGEAEIDAETPAAPAGPPAGS